MSTTSGPMTSSAVNFLTYVADYAGNPGSVGGASSVEPSATQVMLEERSLEERSFVLPSCERQPERAPDFTGGDSVLA